MNKTQSYREMITELNSLRLRTKALFMQFELGEITGEEFEQKTKENIKRIEALDSKLKKIDRLVEDKEEDVYPRQVGNYSPQDHPNFMGNSPIKLIEPEENKNPSILLIVFFVVLLHVGINIMIQAIKCPKMTNTELLLTVHKTFIFNYKNCDNE